MATKFGRIAHIAIEGPVTARPEHTGRQTGQQRQDGCYVGKDSKKASHALTSGTVPHSGQQSGVARRS